MSQVEELVTGGDQGGCETYSPGRVTVHGTLAETFQYFLSTLFVLVFVELFFNCQGGTAF